MYETHYGLREKPFNLTPDPKFLYLSPRHTEAFAHLEFGRQERGGFIVITGEVGTGKTTLARYFLSRLDARTASAFVIYPALSAVELLRSILEDLGVAVTGESLKDHVDALHRFLLEARTQGREVVVLIDEAQDLSAELLEQIRLISNLETDTDKLIQIVLLGQSELHEMLGRRQLRQLAQRVTARYHLGALGRDETAAYVQHRIAVAGGEATVVLTPKALDLIHRASQGVPRLINRIADRALLAGYVRGSRVIDGALARHAVREALGARERLPMQRRAAVIAASCLALATLTGTTWMRARTPHAGPAAPPTASSPPVTIEPLVLAQPRAASLEQATRRIESLWGGAPLERLAFRTTLEQVRRLDLPVVLEMFHPARRDTCYLALLRVEGDQGLVSGGGGEPLRVPLRELDRWWTRQAIFLWKDFDAVASSHDRTSDWARQALTRIGYTPDPADLTAAVARFQRDSRLTVDGRIGARTLMALYSRGSYPRPRLAGVS